MSDAELNIYMGLKIREIRKLRELSQDDLAAAIELTRTSIVNIEKGRTQLTASNIHAICQYLNINPSDIFPDAKNSIDIMIASEIHKLKEERDDWKSKYYNITGILQKLKEHF